MRREMARDAATVAAAAAGFAASASTVGGKAEAPCSAMAVTQGCTHFRVSD